MPIKPVLKMGDPRLLDVARKVQEFGTPELEALIVDMHETMEALTARAWLHHKLASAFRW